MNHDCGHHHGAAHSPLESAHVLALATLTDLPQLEEWCQDLPAHAWGTVYIEAHVRAQMRPLRTPENVSVVWLTSGETTQGSASLDTARPGSRLMRATEAWLDEWVRADPFAGDHYFLWAGSPHLPALRSFWANVEHELAHLWSGVPLHPTHD